MFFVQSHFANKKPGGTIVSHTLADSAVSSRYVTVVGQQSQSTLMYNGLSQYMDGWISGWMEHRSCW